MLRTPSVCPPVPTAVMDRCTAWTRVDRHHWRDRGGQESHFQRFQSSGGSTAEGCRLGGKQGFHRSCPAAARALRGAPRVDERGLELACHTTHVAVGAQE